MMWVYLARHGETDWNKAGRWQGQTDIPLNDAGREQARSLAERLRDKRLAWVASSDLARARETAAIIATQLNVPLVGAEPGLRERRFGLFEGLTREECESHHPEAWARYRSDSRVLPPGSEAHEDVAARMRAAVLATVARHAPQFPGDGLIVAHGSCLRVLLAGPLGRMPGPLPNASWCRLAVEAGAFGVAEGCDF